jgi:large subunit ribosomal protein L30
MSKLKVTQVRSGIGKPQDQRQTLAGLGLKKLRKTVELEDTPSVRGMVKKVIHLVDVEEIE